MRQEKWALNRREFLQSSVMAAVAIGAGPKISKEEEQKNPVLDKKKIRNYSKGMRYHRLGNTDMALSVLTLGGGRLDKELAHHAFEQGVNLVHIGYDYRDSKSITDLAEVLKTKRNKVYIALKDGFLKEAPNDIDPILKMLGTDYVDFIMFNRHKAEQVIDPAIREQFETWKNQGKVRYAGLTTHDNIKACIAAGLDGGWFMLIHPALTQSGMELAAEELKMAFDKGVGIMAMKTMRDIKDIDLQTAQLKKILSNPAITAINKGFSSFDMFDKYLRAVQETLTAEEDFLLYRHAQQNRSKACMMCGACEQVCPRGIDISTLIRCKTYYVDQLGDAETALAAYGELPREKRHDGNCLDCRKCESACPNGIPIVHLLNETTATFQKRFA